MQPRPHQVRGFTLIEISVVLIIIGLIIGGIMVGRDLIRGYQVRKVITEVESLKTAALTFRTKYNCLAGDCAAAESLFGTDPAGCTLPYNTYPRTTTCNGDGNGSIGNSAEISRAIQQLASAALIAGQYTGTCTSTGANCGTNPKTYKAGLAVPQSSAFPYGEYLLYNQTALGSGGYRSIVAGGIWHWVAMPRGHVIYFSADMNQHAGQSGTITGFTGADAKAIDTKLDDGLPALGSIVTVMMSNVALCHTSVVDTASTYITSGASCSLVFSAGF